MSLFEVEITVVVSIPVEAPNEDAALDIAFRDALDRHLASGNFEVQTIRTERGVA